MLRTPVSWFGRRGSSTPREVDLEAALHRRTSAEVRFDAESRAAYSTDASNYRQVPIAVVCPRSKQDLIETVRTCREHHVPVLARGGGTSLAGQCCNVAVVLDLSKHYHQVLDLDPARRTIRLQPGIVLDAARAIATRHALTIGPDPATHDRCTLGGMIGNNSCGMHAQMAGRMSDNVESIEVLTYDGHRFEVGATSDAEYAAILRAGGRRAEIYRGMRALRDKYGDLIRARYPKIPRRISGYNLDDLLPENGFHVARALVGSEGTLITALEATVRLVKNPEARTLVVLGYPTVFDAADHVPEVVKTGPIALEGMDDVLIEGMRRKGLKLRDLSLLPPGRGWLMAEFGADTPKESAARAGELIAAVERMSGARPVASFVDDPHQARLLWEIREAALAATARIPGDPDTWEGWEDAAVAPDKLGSYLREFRALLARYRYHGGLYGHFGHGCVHTRISFDLETAGGVERFRQFVDEAADLVVKHGGSLSGEHGDGQSRAELLSKMFGSELVRAFEELKAIWDPENGMNPHKLVRPYKITENLRLGPDYAPPRMKTHFAFPEENGDFARATTRCVGVGKCRKLEGGVMCPSFMVTREEVHSTRGRSRLLFEMLEGNPIRGGWKSEAVHDALDLCLACKGCKRECPVNVDMATYKAEFLSHHYRGRPRPRHAYAFGLVMFWLALGGGFAPLVNALTQHKWLSKVLRWLGGIARDRPLPPLAEVSFQRRSWTHRARNPTGPQVVLFPDTFNNYFHPEVGEAAIEVLEAAGFNVRIPRVKVCCGRPLYDYGMLDTAKALLRRTLQQFRAEIRARVPFVMLEPSCAAVFRDELRGLFPDDEDAKRLSAQTFLLSEFIEKHAPDFEPPKLHAKALVQGHCHHRAVLDFDAEEKLLRRFGVVAEIPDTGCCGMAGAFGYEKEHYGISVACAERAILPRVRRAPDDVFILADGYSCREQISQLTDRKPLHVAELARLALRPEIAQPRPGVIRVPATKPWHKALVFSAVCVLTAVALSVRE